MTYPELLDLKAKFLATLLRHVDAPPVGHRLPVASIDPTGELSKRACRLLLANGAIIGPARAS